MSSLYSDKAIEAIKTFKGILQKVAVWIFVAGVIFGAIMIMFGSLNEMSTFGRLLGTLFVLALAMLISVNNFRRIETGDKVVQGFATLGLVMNLLWMILWIVIIWGADLYVWTCSGGCGYGVSAANCVDAYNCRDELSVIGKIAYISSYLSALGFLGSNIMAIWEGKKKGVIRPLKITALVCVIYEFVYSTIITVITFKYDEVFWRSAGLAVFAGLVWLLTTLIAVVLSKRQKNAEALEKEKAEKEELLAKARKADELEAMASAGQPVAAGQPVVEPAGAAAPVKTEAELRAEIEEKVRREMIEKEVREKMEKEAAENK